MSQNQSYHLIINSVLSNYTKGDTEENDGILVSENFLWMVGCLAALGGWSNTRCSWHPCLSGQAAHPRHTGARVACGTRRLWGTCAAPWYFLFFFFFPKLIFKLKPMFVLQLNKELCVPDRNHLPGWSQQSWGWMAFISGKRRSIKLASLEILTIDQKNLQVNFVDIFQCNGKTKIIPQEQQVPAE